jgi:hypothetical protein
VVALCLMLIGCKTVKHTVEVPVYIHDTTQTVKEVHDSTYNDRWHTIYQKDDTIYMHDSIYVTHWKIKTDTIYSSTEIPIPITNTETVEVEKPLTWWQKTFVWIGVLCLIGIVLWVVLKLRKLIFKT